MSKQKTWVERVGKGPRKAPNENNKLLQERSISSITPAKDNTDAKEAWVAKHAKRQAMKRPAKTKQLPTKGKGR